MRFPCNHYPLSDLMFSSWLVLNQNLASSKQRECTNRFREDNKGSVRSFIKTLSSQDWASLGLWLGFGEGWYDIILWFIILNVMYGSNVLHWLVFCSNTILKDPVIELSCQAIQHHSQGKEKDTAQIKILFANKK